MHKKTYIKSQLNGNSSIYVTLKSTWILSFLGHEKFVFHSWQVQCDNWFFINFFFYHHAIKYGQLNQLISSTVLNKRLHKICSNYYIYIGGKYAESSEKMSHQDPGGLDKLFLTVLKPKMKLNCDIFV